MADSARRMARERRTVEAMVRLYCQDHHNIESGWCDACQDLASYAGSRLDRCPFGADKPTCARCPVHCYQPEKREQIRAVMRYAGPRMLFRHPVLALLHLFDGLRKVPSRSSRDRELT
jgi:hypothetical protein